MTTAPTNAHSPRPTGVVAASVAFCSVFAAGAAPIPLYSTYRAEDGITTDQLALAAVVYFLGAIATLLLLARLSDHLGRRPLTWAALGVAALGCVAFLLLDDAAFLFVGRGLQGVAAGLASSAIAAFVVDTGARSARWVAPTITGVGAMIGLAGGALGSGALVDLAPLPRILPFVGALALLLIAAVLTLRAPETVERRPGALASLRPRLVLPRSARRAFVSAGSVLVATWALGGYYQAFGPTIARDDLESPSAFVAAAVFSSYLALAVLGGPLAQRLSPRSAQRVGLIVIVVSIGGLVLALDAHSVAAFVALSALAGIAQGVASEGSMRSLLPHASAGERAGLLAVVYATSYAGAASTSLVSGMLSVALPLRTITLGYGALALVALVVVVLRRDDGDGRDREPRRGSAGS